MYIDLAALEQQLTDHNQALVQADGYETAQKSGDATALPSIIASQCCNSHFSASIGAFCRKFTKHKLRGTHTCHSRPEQIPASGTDASASDHGAPGVVTLPRHQDINALLSGAAYRGMLA
jgi:hypothetical protein